MQYFCVNLSKDQNWLKTIIKHFNLDYQLYRTTLVCYNVVFDKICPTNNISQNPHVFVIFLLNYKYIEKSTDNHNIALEYVKNYFFNNISHLWLYFELKILKKINYQLGTITLFSNKFIINIIN